MACGMLRLLFCSSVRDVGDFRGAAGSGKLAVRRSSAMTKDLY